jgi:hypothetical protein
VVIVPVEVFPLETPSTLQFTLVFVVPVTVAVNCCVWVVITTAATLGETVTETTGGGGGGDDDEPPSPQAVNIEAATKTIAALGSVDFLRILNLSVFGIGSLVDRYRDRRGAAGLRYAV